MVYTNFFCVWTCDCAVCEKCTFLCTMFFFQVSINDTSFLSCDKSLSHVAPLRNYFLKEENYRKIKRPPGDIAFLLVQRFGELIRKLWNPCNFKAHVSPHEMLQAVVLCSKKRFQITKQGKNHFWAV